MPGAFGAHPPRSPAFRIACAKKRWIRSVMLFRVLAIGFLLVSPANLGDATADGETAEALVETARGHFAIHENARSSGQASAPSRKGQTEVRYDLPSGERFATYYLNSDGALRELGINSPTSKAYAKTSDRRAFLERLMEIAAPRSTLEERSWAALQLDGIWSERVRPFPVQVGDYVFGGITVRSPRGAHDHFTIVATDTGARGMTFERRRQSGAARPLSRQASRPLSDHPRQ